MITLDRDFLNRLLCECGCVVAAWSIGRCQESGKDALLLKNNDIICDIESTVAMSMASFTYPCDPEAQLQHFKCTQVKYITHSPYSMVVVCFESKQTPAQMSSCAFLIKSKPSYAPLLFSLTCTGVKRCTLAGWGVMWSSIGMKCWKTPRPFPVVKGPLARYADLISSNLNFIIVAPLWCESELRWLLVRWPLPIYVVCVL